MASNDPLALSGDVVSLHQTATFVKGAAPLAEAVKNSPLFATRHVGGAVRAEWIALAADDPLPFPLGRVTVHTGGVLLEGFSESRVNDLLRKLDGLGSLHLTADQTRALRMEDLLIDPGRAMHPVEEGAGREAGREDVARWYLRAGWPFEPCAALDGRTPCTAARTGRGRARVEGLLGDLGPALARRWAGFPAFDAETLHDLLFEPAPSPAKPSPRGAPRRA